MENEKNGGTSGVIPPCPVDRWTIDYGRCVVCGECVDACRKRLIKIKDKIIVMDDSGGCNQCGDCSAACGYHAIIFS